MYKEILLTFMSALLELFELTDVLADFCTFISMLDGI